MKLSKKISTFLVCSVFLLAICYPLFTKASPPPMTTYYATDWDIPSGRGDHYSGNLYSSKYDDSNYLIARADWTWFIFWIFWADIEFEFPNVLADVITVEVRDNVIRNNMLVTVYYTSGNPETFPKNAGEWDNGWLSDGTYTFEVDDSRTVDWVKVIFWHTGGWGDKYLKVDMIKLIDYNIPF
ncbi:MAG: hypothetical protein ACFFG0_31955 [Candidatus Thorarchaeota archaeon]